MSKALWFIVTSCFRNSCFLPLSSLLCPYRVGAGRINTKTRSRGEEARSDSDSSSVFSMSGVIVYSVFSCTVSVPGGGAVVCV